MPTAVGNQPLTPQQQIDQGAKQVEAKTKALETSGKALEDKAWVQAGSGIPAVQPDIGKQLFRTPMETFAEGVAGSDAVMPKGQQVQVSVGATAGSPVSYQESKSLERDRLLPADLAGTANGLAGVSLQWDSPRWSMGVDGLASAAADAQLPDQAVRLYNQAQNKALPERVDRLTTDIRDWRARWQSQETRAIVTDIQTDIKRLRDKGLSSDDKRTIINHIAANHRKLEPLLNDLHKLVGDSDTLMGDTRQWLSGLGDGSQTASVDVAAGGLIQSRITGRVPIKSPTRHVTDLTLMGQAKVLVIPDNPAYDAKRHDMPQSSYALGEIKLMAQVTLRGMTELQQALNDAHALLGDADQAVRMAKAPAAVALEYQFRPEQLVSDLERVNARLDAMDRDLAQVSAKTEVQIDVVAKAVMPTFPVGVGSAVGISGTVADTTKVAVVVDNPLGFVAGKQETWRLDPNQSLDKGDVRFSKMGEKERNVYYDFFPVKLRVVTETQLPVKSQTQVVAGLETAFGDSSAFYAGANQPLGQYVTVGAGGLYRTDHSGQVGAGVSVGPKEKWQIHLQGASNHVLPQKTSQASARLGFDIHF